MSEEKIRAITRIYYSNPKVQEAILKFSIGREIVPRYYEGFGKRPDGIQYPSDVMGWVNKGATSLHASEEIWRNPLELNSDLARRELDDLRENWDLLIDIDSKYLDFSKIALKLILEEFERYGIKNYGIKFSGSRGFHVIVPAKAFPKEFNGMQTKDMFPEWPRAICELLINKITPKYNQKVKESGIDYEAIKLRTNLSKEDLTDTMFEGGVKAKKGKAVTFRCPECGGTILRHNPKMTKRKLMCVQDGCPGFYEVEKEEDAYYSEDGKISSLSKKYNSNVKVVYSDSVRKEDVKDVKEELIAGRLGSLDLVFVAPRHLFRMPYSLHEKTALASVVISKDEIDNFSMKDANPLKVKIKDFYPEAREGEAVRLLAEAVEFRKEKDVEEEKEIKKKYSGEYKEVDIKNVSEDMFPKPIKKLLKGLKEGKKRGLFILITFLRSLNFSPEYINNRIREWNKLNESQLKEVYIKSQIEWHLKQKKKILPPNYSNASFYKDLGLLEGEPKAKNPLVEVKREIWKREA